MSAKGRGEHLGGEHDVYPTPAWAVHRLLDRLAPDILRPGLWLEPCAGYGAIIRACSDHKLTANRIIWSACDIRSEIAPLLTASLASTGSPPPVIGDFLMPEREEILRECTVVLTNPPFSLAERFLHKCLAVAPLAHVIFLLRTNFVGSERRSEWLRDHMPDSYQLPQRPSFRDDDDAGGTDSAEYAWLVWGPGSAGRIRRRGHVELLDPTPKEFRRRDREEAKALLSGVEFKAPQLGLFGGSS